MVVDGIIKYMKLAHPDVDDYDNETWQVTLEVSGADAAELTTAGHKSHKDDENIFTFKRKTTWPSGDAKDTPRCLDADAMPLDAGTVGRGSKGRIQYKIIEGVWKKKPYKMFDFCAVQVTELIEYGGADGDELGAVKGKTDDDPF